MSTKAAKSHLGLARRSLWALAGMGVLKLSLTAEQKRDLIEYLKSI